MDKIVMIPFHGNEIVSIEKGEKKYVAMKPLVNAMGLVWRNQYDMLKRDSVLGPTVIISMTVAADGRKRKMVCLPLDFLNCWLFKVPAVRYKGERRKVIELYQKECCQVLYDYWNHGGAVNPDVEAAQAVEIVEKVADAGEGRFPEEFSEILKTLCKKLEESAMAIAHAAEKIVYLENFEPRSIPCEISKKTGRPKDRFTRGYYTSNRSAKNISKMKLAGSPFKNATA